MIKIVFFSKYRERFGAGSVDFPLDGATTVQELLVKLKAAFQDRVDFLDDKNLTISISQKLAKNTSTLTFGDIVAFYPPVTGG